MDTACGQFMILMMDLEEKLEQAESIHFFVTILIRSQWDGSVDFENRHSHPGQSHALS